MAFETLTLDPVLLNEHRVLLDVKYGIISNGEMSPDGPSGNGLANACNKLYADTVQETSELNISLDLIRYEFYLLINGFLDASYVNWMVILSRCVVGFDTSVIADRQIVQAYFKLTGSFGNYASYNGGEIPDTNWYVLVQKCQDSYDKSLWSGDLARIFPTAGFGDKSQSLNHFGINYINKSGLTLFGFRLTPDLNQYIYPNLLNRSYLYTDNAFSYYASGNIGYYMDADIQLVLLVSSKDQPIFNTGQGYDYRTSKQAVEDVAQLAIGRMYVDASGNINYESRNVRA